MGVCLCDWRGNFRPMAQWGGNRRYAHGVPANGAMVGNYRPMAKWGAIIGQRRNGAQLSADFARVETKTGLCEGQKQGVAGGGGFICG